MMRKAFVVLVTAAALCLTLLFGPLAVMPGTYGVSAAFARTVAHASVVGGKMAEPGTFPWMAFVVDLR